MGNTFDKPTSTSLEEGTENEKSTAGDKDSGGGGGGLSDVGEDQRPKPDCQCKKRVCVSQEMFEKLTDEESKSFCVCGNPDDPLAKCPCDCDQKEDSKEKPDYDEDEIRDLLA